MTNKLANQLVISLEPVLTLNQSSNIGPKHGWMNLKIYRFQQAGYRDEIKYKQIKHVDVVES